MRKLPPVAICLLGLMAFARAARAGCILANLDVLLRSANITAVFRGAAVQIKTVPAGQVVTFRVTRVWKDYVKGDIHQDLVIYSWLRKDDGSGIFEPGFDVPFEAGKEYLVSAHRQSPLERERFGLPRSAVEDSLGVNDGASSCVTRPFESPEAQTILGGAPGRPPR